MSTFRDSVRRFMVAEVLPHLDQWERDGELPRELHKKAGQLGLLGVAFPEAVGGGGGSLSDALGVVEEMHYAGGSGGLVASLLTCGIAFRISLLQAIKSRSIGGCGRRWTVS